MQRERDEKIKCLKVRTRQEIRRYDLSRLCDPSVLLNFLNAHLFAFLLNIIRQNKRAKTRHYTTARVPPSSQSKAKVIMFTEVHEKSSF